MIPMTNNNTHNEIRNKINTNINNNIWLSIFPVLQCDGLTSDVRQVAHHHVMVLRIASGNPEPSQAQLARRELPPAFDVHRKHGLEM